VGSRYEPNSKVLRRNRDVDLLTIGNVITALGWFDNEVLDNSSKKQIDPLFRQRFTNTRSTACHSNISHTIINCFVVNFVNFVYQNQRNYLALKMKLEF